MPKGRPKKVKEVKAEVVAVEQVKDGTFKGEYSTSLYNNGELISFDIDWDMLKKHVQSATVGYK
jgi:hypothetical protein